MRHNMAFNVEKVFGSTGEALQREFQEIAQQIEHLGERGTGLEGKVKQFLSEHLPTRFSVSDGTVVARVDDSVEQSRQIDVVIRDRYWSSEILDFGGSVMHPVESVFGVISVKSKLSIDELVDSYENVRSVHKLAYNTLKLPDVIRPPYVTPEEEYPLFGGLFAFDLGTKVKDLHVIKRKLRKLDEAHIQPLARRGAGLGCVCVLGHGIIAYSPDAGKSLETCPDLDVAPVVLPDPGRALIRFLALLTAHISLVPIRCFGLLEYAPSRDSWGAEV